ncbi:hypothetical protein [Streptomyces sp. NPDC059063]|uniref:hypothetical protein n=1 Tax=unclassified Streptomyces TaxID=2593676 RepID=UPI00368B8AF2
MTTRRVRTTKTSDGATTVRIPGQRGRKGQTFVLLVQPGRPTPARRVLAVLGRLLWRPCLLPTGLAVLLLALTAILHVLAPWTAYLLAGAGLIPLAVVLARPVSERKDGGRFRESLNGLLLGVALGSAAVGLWAALAVELGPLAGPLEILWFLGLLAAQGLRLLPGLTSKEKD